MADHQRQHPGAIGWLLENRKTGELTIAQFPNIALGLFAVAAGLARFAVRSGSSHHILEVIWVAALGIWSLDEIVRGVNPFRRILGAVVGAAIITTLVARH